MEDKYKWYERFRAKNCSKDLGGCTKSAKPIRKCARVVVVPEKKKKTTRKNTKKTKKPRKNKRKQTRKKTRKTRN